MRVVTTPESVRELTKALRQMLNALDILDELDAPGEVASHLDLAINRLEQVLGHGAHAETGVQTLIAQLERELAEQTCAPDAQVDPWRLEPI